MKQKCKVLFITKENGDSDSFFTDALNNKLEEICKNPNVCKLVMKPVNSSYGAAVLIQWFENENKPDSMMIAGLVNSIMRKLNIKPNISSEIRKEIVKEITDFFS